MIRKWYCNRMVFLFGYTEIILYNQRVRESVIFGINIMCLSASGRWWNRFPRFAPYPSKAMACTRRCSLKYWAIFCRWGCKLRAFFLNCPPLRSYANWGEKRICASACRRLLCFIFNDLRNLRDLSRVELSVKKCANHLHGSKKLTEVHCVGHI